MDGGRFGHGLNLQDALLRGWKPYADTAARVFRTTVMRIAREDKASRSRTGQTRSPSLAGYGVAWTSDDAGDKKTTQHILEFWPWHGVVIYTDNQTKGVFKASRVSAVIAASDDTYLRILSGHGDNTSEISISTHGIGKLIYRHHRQCGASAVIIIDIQHEEATCICHSGDVLELSHVKGFAHKDDALILKTDDGRTYCEYTVTVDKVERALISPFGGDLAKAIYTECFRKAWDDIQLRKHMENHHQF